MTKNNFIVITGGPGSGKSTMLESLSTVGYRFIGESARAVIKERLNRGLPPRPGPAEFARQLFEIDLENYLNNIDVRQPLFFDRSFLDSAAMMVEADASKIRVIKIVNTYRFRKTVFVTPPWKEIYRTDSERDQSYEESVEVYKKLCKWYELNEYELIEIPKTSIDNRIRFVLDGIK